MHEALRAFLADIDELSDTDREAIAPLIQVDEYPQGHLLLQAGEIACRCYHVLRGCVRQYQLIDGKDKTTAFFTEGQTIVSFASYTQQQPVAHYWECLEDCVLIVGDMVQERDAYEQFPQLEVITRRMMAEDFGEMQREMSAFMTASPRDRYLRLLETRPELLQRVPQHQLASFLGVTPESLSRIRRRLRERS
ncbi:MAG: Crp/Fnr family transcriptional regulator [Bacteroidetes bacterium]|nr:MAG: Crp/Fnr family transcriptional regulator [Bacteroidota bacterium]